MQAPSSYTIIKCSQPMSKDGSKGGRYPWHFLDNLSADQMLKMRVVDWFSAKFSAYKYAERHRIKISVKVVEYGREILIWRRDLDEGG